MGAIPYASLIDTDYKITSDDPKELSKKYRLYEGQMLQVICQVSKENMSLQLQHIACNFFYIEIGLHHELPQSTRFSLGHSKEWRS